MNIMLVILGTILLALPVAAILIKTAGGQSQETYEKILDKVNPYLEADDANRLSSILEAINTAASGKKEVKTSSNTATLAKYQRKAETLETNIAQLVADISDLDDFKNEEQIKKYVSGNVKKLLTRSGITEWAPSIGSPFNTATMVNAGGAGNNVVQIRENGYKSGDQVVIKARVVLG